MMDALCPPVNLLEYLGLCLSLAGVIVCIAWLLSKYRA